MVKLVHIIFILVLGCSSQQTPHKMQEIIQLQDNEVALFGYGSLNSVQSMERTLGRKYDGIFKTVYLQGWKRMWNVAMPNTGEYKRFYFEENNQKIYPENILYLNIEKDESSTINGCLFIIQKSELKLFDEREWIYRKEDISQQLSNIQIKNGKAWVYVALDKHILNDVKSSQKAIIRQTYLDILEDAFEDLGKEFEDFYHQSTQTVPQHLVVKDRRIEN
jgi:hypothetical protein